RERAEWRGGGCQTVIPL
ncbi:hypothetical protein ACJX0J_041685, partial [Zea mays]